MIPWDNSTTEPIKSNVTRNPFVSMIAQLIKEVFNGNVVFKKFACKKKVSRDLINIYIF